MARNPGSRPDSRLATALQSASSRAVATPAGAGKWPAQGRAIESLSPFATAAGGQAEADRQAAFFDGPLVRDRIVVPGIVRGLVKRCIRVTAPGLDYPEDGSLAIVLGAAEQQNGTTVLIVLRKLT